MLYRLNFRSLFWGTFWRILHDKKSSYYRYLEHVDLNFLHRYPTSISLQIEAILFILSLSSLIVFHCRVGLFQKFESMFGVSPLSFVHEYSIPKFDLQMYMLLLLLLGSVYKYFGGGWAQREKLCMP